MAYTRKELSDEFWMLTKGILQDSTVDTDEARVIKRWLEEHAEYGNFTALTEKLEGFLVDGYIDRFESKKLLNTFGEVLRQLRTA